MYWIFKNNFYKAFEKYYDFLTYNMSDMTQWVKNPPANAGDIRDVGSIPRLGRSPGEGNSNPVQYSCLGNPMDRGAWWTTAHGVAKSWTGLKRLSTCVRAHTHTCMSERGR